MISNYALREIIFLDIYKKIHFTPKNRNKNPVDQDPKK